MVAGRKLNIAVIGIGHWGPNLCRNFINHSDVEMKYVCDIDEHKFDKIQNILPERCLLTTDISKILLDRDVEAVVIATPASTHYALVKQALSSGKHVLSEKPLTLHVEESEELCELAAAHNKKLMVGFTFLFNKCVKYLGELSRAGTLGRIYYLTSARTHMGLVREDVDAVWDLAPHDISIMNFIVGANPIEVSAAASTPLGFKHCDVAFITLYYPDGIIGQIHVSWVDSNKERTVRIIGQKARVEFDDLNDLEPIRIFQKGISPAESVAPNFGNFRFLLRDGDIISPAIKQSEPLKEMVDAFVKYVLDGTSIIPDGRYAVDMTKTLVAIQKSLNSRGARQLVNN
jgi:predicted dehydrogenase